MNFKIYFATNPRLSTAFAASGGFFFFCRIRMDSTIGMLIHSCLPEYAKRTTDKFVNSSDRSSSD